ncbi:hypothetical protein B296_00005062, partial [Ensete ventricosum]
KKEASSSSCRRTRPTHSSSLRFPVFSRGKVLFPCHSSVHLRCWNPNFGSSSWIRAYNILPESGPFDRNDGVVDLFEMAIFGLFSKIILLFSRWVIKRSERTICNVSPDLCVLVKSYIGERRKGEILGLKVKKKEKSGLVSW